MLVTNWVTHFATVIKIQATFSNFAKGKKIFTEFYKANSHLFTIIHKSFQSFGRFEFWKTEKQSVYTFLSVCLLSQQEAHYSERLQYFLKMVLCHPIATVTFDYSPNPFQFGPHAIQVCLCMHAIPTTSMDGKTVAAITLVQFSVQLPVVLFPNITQAIALLWQQNLKIRPVAQGNNICFASMEGRY